jgi:hypothetical protein
MRITTRQQRRLAVALLALTAFVPALAEGGVGELALDRNAVTSLIRAGMPDSIPVELPGLGTVQLVLSSPSPVEFTDGGVEIPVGFSVPDVGLAGTLRIRYVPRVDRVEGFVGLSAESAVAEAPVRLPFDLSHFLPDVELPPELAWRTEDEAGTGLRLVVRPQGLEIDDDRMTVRFGLAARREGP